MKAGDGNERDSQPERRIQSLERSPARTTEKLSKIQSPRWRRAAGAYWRLRAEVALVLSYIIHPTAAFKLAAHRLLPIRLRLRLLKLVRHEPTLDARFYGEERELGGLPAPAGQDEACHATVLFLPAVPWSFRRQSPQHLAAHVAALGWPVAWVLGETVENEEAVVGEDLAPGVRGIRLPHHEALSPLSGSLEEADAAALGEALVRWRRRHRIHEVVVVCESPYWVRLAEWLKQHERWPLIYDLIDLAGSQEEFLQRLDPAVRRPDDEESRKARRAFAERNGWEERAAALAREMKSCFPPVSIAIATYNNISLTRLCLESVRTRTVFPNYQVIVVDNGSTDGTQEYLEREAAGWPELSVVFNDGNLGFAAANNQALRFADGEILVLLNNDTVVTRGWLCSMVRALAGNPRWGLVGAVTNSIGNEARITTGYKDLSELDSWAEDYVWRTRGKSFPIGMLALFCAGFRREVWERVGELDERFEVGMFEDDDYSRRVRQAGYEVRCLRDCYVHHWHQASFRLLGTEEYQRVFEANRKRFLEKWSLSSRAGAKGAE